MSKHSFRDDPSTIAKQDSAHSQEETDSYVAYLEEKFRHWSEQIESSR